MNNPKILKKVLVAALTLAMIVGAFSMFAVGTSAASADAFKWLDGVDFNGYTGTTQADAHAYIYEQTGMYFTSQSGTSAATNVDIKDGALYFSSFSYVSGGTGDSKISSDKYAKSSDVLDLFFTANGPKKYTLEFDLVITDKILPTSEGSTKPSSPYRGCSMISFGRYNWFVKATSVGVSTYEMVDGVFTPNNDAQADVGYFYADGATIEATETNGVAAATSTVKTGPVTGAMPAGKDKLVAYKIGEPVNIKIEFTKNASNTSAVTYVNGTKLSTKTVAYTDQYKAHGIRWGDSNYAKFSVDNLKLTVNECNADHSTDWSVISNDGTKVSVGYDSLDIVAPCSCGDLLPVGSVNNALVTADYVYGGNAAIEGLPTAGEFWVATDYNVRTAEALAAATNIMKIGNEAIAVGANMTAPETYSVALKVTYTAEKVADLEVYINGELSEKRTGVALENATTLYLGDEGATSDIRFFRTKIVEIGNEAAVKVTYNNMDDETLRPCKHNPGDSNIITGITRGENGELSYTYQCDKCGEWIYNVAVSDSTSKATGIPFDENGKWSYAGGGSTLTKYLTLPEDYIGKDKDPYQLEFKLTLDSLMSTSSMTTKEPSSGLGNYIADGTYAQGRSIFNSFGAKPQYSGLLRQFPAIKDDGSHYPDRIDIRSKNTKDAIYLTTMFVGDSKTFTLYITPAKQTVEIYVDGEYVTTRTDGYLATNNTFRFNDGAGCGFTVSDFKLIRKAETEAHVHSDKWATSDERSLLITDRVLECNYTCYCGEKVPVGQITSSLVPEGIRNVYANETSLLDAPTAPYWLTVDYNVRTADAPTEAYILINGTKLDLTTLVEAVGPTTHIVAVSVIDNENYKLYIDSEYIGVYTAENLLAEGGSIELATGENVRFNNIKLVTVGETDTPVVPTYIIDETVRPCAHMEGPSQKVYFVTVPGEKYGSNSKVKAVNKLLGYYSCEICGERIYEGADDVLTVKDTGSLTLDETGSTGAVSGTKMLHIDREEVSSAYGPYWVSFDIKGEFTAKQVEALNNKSVFNVQVPYTTADWVDVPDNNAYIHLMRAYRAPDGNGGFRDDAVGFKFYQGDSGKPTFIMENGKTYNVAIYVDVQEDKILVKAYINGVLVDENTKTNNGKVVRAFQGGRTDDKISALTPAFRFNASNTGATFYYSNFAFVRAGEEEHTHSDKWLTPEEKANTTVRVLDNKTLAYEYDCYCGERATAGIKTVLADNIKPQYNLTCSAVAVETPVLDEKAIFAGELAVEELPAEGIKALVSLGELAMVSVDADGVVYVGETATETVLAADAQKYTDFAVFFENGIYTVYIDGANIGNGEYDTVAAITVGSEEEMGSVHFDRMVLATVDPYQNNVYECNASHEHIFDPNTVGLKFNEDRTSITIDYTCLVCDRPCVDGITEDLYSQNSTELIPAIVDTTDAGTVVLDSVLSGKTSYWFSADFGVVSYNTKNIQPVVSLGDKAIVLLDANGTIRLNDNKYTIIGAIDSNQTFNVTFSVEIVEGISVVQVYVDGKYYHTYELDGIADVITLGGENSHRFSAGNIKFVKLGNDGSGVIGNVSGTYHTFDYTKTQITYVSNGTFIVTNRCRACGMTVTEKPAYNKYVGEMLPIYDSWGNIELSLNKDDFGEELKELYHGYWIVADVNVRSESIGTFDGYKNLIGENGLSYVLVNKDMRLMLGDGTFSDTSLDSISTSNIAVEVVDIDVDDDKETDDRFINVYVDGTYVGSADIADINYKYEYNVESEKHEEFGAAGLENIKFYNIKSFIPCAKGDFVTFTYTEDDSIVPCPHIIGSAESESLVALSKVDVYFICSACGERVYGSYDTSLYDASKNSDFKFENGVKTITSTTTLNSSSDVLGSKGSNYWLNFKLGVVSVNANGVGADNNNSEKGRNFLNFNTNYNSPLRLYAIPNPDGGYYQDRLLVRSNNTVTSTVVGTIFAGETYDIELYVNPAAKTVDIYFDGEFITTRTNATHATGTQIRFLDGAWGTFNISEFEFLTCGVFKHEHTNKYSEEIGVIPTIHYGDETLKYNYKCICGETIVEGISKKYADNVSDIIGVTDATAIPEAASVKMSATPYWVSSRVYSDGEKSTVYSYGGTAIVGIDGEYFTVGGKKTEKKFAGAGDYNVVSIQVMPESDRIDVFVDGYCIGSLAQKIEDSEKFNIKVGGGASLDFSFVKVVSLAEGSNGTVTSIPVCTHEFGYRYGITAQLTDTGVSFNCRYCDEKLLLRTVIIGDGNKLAISKYDASKGDRWIADFTDYKDTIFGKSLDGTFFITFNVNASSLGGVTGDTRKSFVTWTPATSVSVNEETGEIIGNSTGYEHLISLKKIDGKYVVVLGSDLDTAGVMELNKDHNFVLEIDSANSRYYAYMDGQYLGSAKINIELDGKNYYPLRVNNGTGDATFTNFQMFKPEVDQPENVPVVEEPELPCVHFPDVGQTESKTISVKNGVIEQKFKCVCGETIVRNTMNNIVDEKIDSKFTRLSISQSIQVGDKLSYGTDPFIMSFDLSADAINVSAIVRKTISGNKNGASLLAIVRPEDEELGVSTGYTHLLRAFGHPYKDGEGYSDVNGDGYADEAIDLRTGTSKDLPVIATVDVSKTVNITYVIDPTQCKAVVYLDLDKLDNNDDCQYIGTPIAINKYTADDLYVRILDAGYGSLNFKNFKLVRMTDECKHVGPACDGIACDDPACGAPACDGIAHVGKCNNCDAIVEVVHNYTAQRDMTGKWIKYTCACGATYVAFDDMAILADIKYTNKYDLLAYLTEKYYPIFR